MKSIIKGLVVALLLATGITANAAQDIQIYTADNSNGKITPESIDKAFKDAGFYITMHNDMNLAFQGKFDKTNHKIYHLMAVHKDDIAFRLIKDNPDAGLITPLSMSIYADKGSNNISISTISLDGMAKITGISKTNKDLVELSNLLNSVITKAMPNGHFEKLSYKILKPEGELTSRFEGEMDVTPKELEEEIESMQEELEGSLETGGFVVAGFNNFNDALKESGNNKYDFFDAYSICKISVIYEVSKKYPEAGALAPCTFYMYKEKGSITMKMAFPSVYNWISSLDITDPKAKEVLIKAQKVFVNAVKETIE